jgi:phenylalanyl-tRNA synthetase beta subunit
MKIAVATLNRFFKKPRTTAQLAMLIERTEIELEQVIYSKPLDSKIVLAKIMDIFPHPEADRLQLVTVSVGKHKHDLVCGAPNLAIGQRVAYVQPGSTLPDGSVIEKAVIRGQSSEGMLASGKELGLSNDHSGLWNYEGTTHSLGTSLCDILVSGDVLDIKTPANRWDYLSGEGIARELAVYDDTSNFLPVEVGQYQYSETERVDVKSRAENPRFVSAHVRVKNDVKSPAWLVDNLALNGIATHTPVVDITNYVMLELGQPTHAYDASTLSTPLSVRFSEEGEMLTTLDGVERSLTSQDLVVSDSTGPVGLAGIMGSARCQVESTTTEVIIEAAIWDKTIVRRTALRHGLRTEASTRFERGIPLPSAPRAVSRMLDLLKEICEGEIVGQPSDQLYAWPWQQFLGLRLRHAEKILGHTVDEPSAVKGLRQMGFGVEKFSIAKEFQSHLGKPYKWGANWRQDGETAFDCSYLIDRVYSKIGVFVGHTALGQFHHGRSVETNELKPGDALFIRGVIIHSKVDHYYTTTPNGEKKKVVLDEAMEVGHCAVYIGNGQVIQARGLAHADESWAQGTDQGVSIAPVERFTEAPDYLGARRYVENFNHTYAIDVPWWRPDIRMEADLIEEVGKLVGYDKIANTLPDIPAMAESEGTLADSMRLRRRLSSAGMTEVMTYSFVSAEAVQASGIPESNFLPISNPRSPEQAYVRASLMPSHAHLWSQQSSAVRPSVLCFEISTVFLSQGLTQLPLEKWQIGLSARGEKSLAQVQSALQYLMKSENIKYELVPDAKVSTLVKQRSAQILVDGEEIGVIGQLSSGTAESLGLKTSLAWCEIDLRSWLSARRPAQLPALPAYQLVVRDISYELAADVWYQSIAQYFDSRPEVWSVEYIDTYQDESLLATQRKVVTLRVLLDCGARPSGDHIERIVSDLSASLAQDLPEAQLTSR